MTKDKALTGAAGEYYVAFRLAAEGYAVGLTPRGTTSIDLIVANPETGKTITIQTKTMRDALVPSKTHGPYWKWRTGKPQEPQKTFFYAFINLKNDPSQAPDVFIVPSRKLAPPLLEIYPEIGEPRDFWCVIYEKDRQEYSWDVIKAALEESS